MQNRVIRDFIFQHKGRIIVMLIFAAAMVLLNISIIESGKRIIDVLSKSGIEANDKSVTLLRYCSFILIAAIVSGITNYLLGNFYAKYNQSLLCDIRQKLFNHLLSLPQNFYNEHTAGPITTGIMDEVFNIGKFFSKLLLQPVINVITVFFFGFYLLHLNWQLFVAGTLFVPISIIIIPRFARRTKQLTNESWIKRGDMFSYLQEVFTGVGDIRSNQTYLFEQSRMKKRLNDLYAVSIDLENLSSEMSSILKVITYLGPLSIYFFGGVLCIRGGIPVGTIVAATVVLNNLYNPVNELVNFVLEWKQVKVAFDKLNGYFRFEPEKGILPDKKDEVIVNRAIQFNKVKFGFTPEEMLLHDINFTAEEGKKVALVGTSGSGKSLTTSLLTGTYPLSDGVITVGGDNIENIPLYDLRSQIGHVSQAPFMFNDTIKNNIIYSLLRKDCNNGSEIEKWIDYSLFKDIDDPKLLDKQVINVIRDVGFFDDVFAIGLCSKLSKIKNAMTDAEKGSIIQARKSFIQELSQQDSQYIEFYNEGKFLEYCSLLENIVFCPTAEISEIFGSANGFYKLYLKKILAENGLLDSYFNMGLNLVTTDSLLLEKLHKDKSPLLGYINSDSAQVESIIKINERLPLSSDSFHQIERSDPSLFDDISMLALGHTSGKSKIDLITDKIQTEILNLREILKKRLPEETKNRIAFFHPDKYMSSLSISENIVFGNVNPQRKRAKGAINDLLKDVVRKSGIEELIIKVGLEFNIGERGSKLSGGQKQKIAIARIMLKNPSILILDEATAALDAVSQTHITKLIEEKCINKTVHSIAHRLNSIKDYDQIIVFDKGYIVQKGNFEELMQQDGLFKKLFEGSN